MGKLVGLTFPEPPAMAAKGKAASLSENPLAAKYKRMKTAELEVLLEERGIEVPENVTNNPQRVALLVQADEAEAAQAEAGD